MLILALSVGILAFVWTWFTVATAGTLYIAVWITFISWAAFFLTGGEKKTILVGMIPLVTGAIYGYLCILVMNLIVPAFNVALIAFLVGLAAFCIVMMMSIPMFKSGPSQFLGFAAYFGALFGQAFGPDVPPELVLVYTAISLVAGVLVGLVSVTLPKLVQKNKE